MVSLKAARILAEKTQSEMAELTGVTKATYSCWERGKTEMPTKAFMILSEVSNIPMSEIKLPNETD